LTVKQTEWCLFLYENKTFCYSSFVVKKLCWFFFLIYCITKERRAIPIYEPIWTVWIKCSERKNEKPHLINYYIKSIAPTPRKKNSQPLTTGIRGLRCGLCRNNRSALYADPVYYGVPGDDVNKLRSHCGRTQCGAT